MEKRVYLLVLISVFIFVGLIGVADFEVLLPLLGSADSTMVILSIASYTLAITVFAVIWQFLLKTTDLKLSFGNNLRLVFSSVFFNVVTPTASYGGEAVRLYLLNKRFKQDAGKGVATIVAHRIIGSLSNTLGTIALGFYLILSFEISPALLMVIAVVTLSSLIGFLLILYFGLRIDWSRGAVDKLFKVISRFWNIKDETIEAVHRNLESYHAGLLVLLKSTKTIVLMFGLGLFTWFLVNLVAIFAYLAVGGNLGLENSLIIFTFFSVSRLIPTGLPEFVGSKEAILAILYAASGLPVSTSVAVIILIRVATQLWMVVLGGAVTLHLGFQGFKREN